MCRVIVFAGTTEGRQIAEFLDKRNVPAHICVATEYGEQLLPSGGCLEISHERLDENAMEALMREKGLPLVIDATHPYAAEVTVNIRTACEKTGSSYVSSPGKPGTKRTEKLYLCRQRRAGSFPSGRHKRKHSGHYREQRSREIYSIVRLPE